MINIPCPKTLIEIATKPWFKANSIKESCLAYKLFREKLARVSNLEATPWKAYSLLLQTTTGISSTSVDSYLNWTFDSDNIRKPIRIREEKAKVLDLLLMELGCKVFPRKEGKIKGEKNRIAILTEFSKLPSKDYHIALFNGIQQEARNHYLVTSINEIEEEWYAKNILELILHSCPDGIIIIRKTPDKKALKYLEHINIPTIIINGNRQVYPFNFVGNIVSVLDHPFKNLNLKRDFKKWITGIPTLGKEKKVIVAHMPLNDTHRGNRVRFIRTVLQEEGYEAQSFIVEDYQGTHARQLLNTHPHASAYICLSDPLAVTLRHLLEVKGESCKNRVIGFDDSPLAKKENLSSFGQYLYDCGDHPSLGALSVKELMSGLKRKTLEFRPIEVPLYLAIRE